MKVTVTNMFKAAVLTSATLSATITASTVMAADKPDTVTVGYFLEWPTANQIAQVEKTTTR